MDTNRTKKKSFVTEEGDAWELDSLVYVTGGMPRDHAIVASANRRAAQVARLRRARNSRVTVDAVKDV